MCPGLTHANVIEELKANPVPPDTPVCILAEGKETALAVGHTQMSSEEIISQNKNIGVNVVHHLNDGLWKVQRLRNLEP
jgi:PUA domain protein